LSVLARGEGKDRNKESACKSGAAVTTNPYKKPRPVFTYCISLKLFIAGCKVDKSGARPCVPFIFVD